MNNKQKSALAIAVAASLAGTGVANATTYTATLVSDVSYSNNGSSAGNLASSSATFTYDDSTTVLTQTGGTFTVQFSAGPTPLFKHNITDLVIGNSAAAGASTYGCAEGTFGGIVGASICGNYNFGPTFTNQSSTTWGPGTSFARTIGGDDVAIGPQQSISAYDTFAQLSFIGTTLKLQNASCVGTSSACASQGGFNAGYTWTLETAVVPVPAAVWLFGSALGLLGVARRKSIA